MYNYKNIKQNTFLYSDEIIECCVKNNDNNMIIPESIIKNILLLWENTNSRTPTEELQYKITKEILDGDNTESAMLLLEARMSNLRAIKERQE